MNNTPTSVPSKTKSLLDLASLFQPVVQELELVEQWLGTNLIDDNAFVSELLAEISRSGGKRVRPGVVLLCSKATSKELGEIGRLHIILAVLTELIHTASLVHDDIVDGASLRRGHQTINRRWNDRLAVLVGDLLFAQASICLARIMNPVIVGIYGQVLGDLCAGEICQMKQQFAYETNWDAYIRKSVSKTASLFAAGCHSGPILNGCNDEIVSAFKAYGLNLGICFQIVDDLLDITATSEELGKASGSDLAQGVITAPALFVLERADEPAKQLAELIKSRAVCQPEGLSSAMEIIRANGGLDATVKLAKQYADASRHALRVLPWSAYRESLELMVDYLLLRTH